jgi:hypothetical protein
MLDKLILIGPPMDLMMLAQLRAEPVSIPSPVPAAPMEGVG